jgi:hypothetical protein
LQYCALILIHKCLLRTLCCCLHAAIHLEEPAAVQPQ